MSEAVVFSKRRTAFIFFIAALLAIFISWQIIIPVRQDVSARYVQRGDAYLSAQEFDSAQKEFQQAISYDSTNQTAKERLEIAKKSLTDIALVGDFYRQQQITAVVQKLDTAQKMYSTPKQALQAGVLFYQNHDFVYAQYPLQRAIELDPGYPEAWHYLSLTYQELTKADPTIQAKADAALKKQNELTAKYLQP